MDTISDREQMEEALKIASDVHDLQIRIRAAQENIVWRGTLEDGRGAQLVRFDNDIPQYLTTENVKAAISTNVVLIREQASFDSTYGPDINGSGFFVNVNDYGVVRQHDEFQRPTAGTRLFEQEPPSGHNHPDHVAGTIGAHGYNSAKGMAPGVNIYAFNQQSTSDITGNGMVWPGQPAVNNWKHFSRRTRFSRRRWCLHVLGQNF